MWFIVCTLFFFFKQKTAYEMRISDCSSDVCSSDLLPLLKRLEVPFVLDHMGRVAAADGLDSDIFRELLALRDHGGAWVKISGVDRKIGRASCRARVCQ